MNIIVHYPVKAEDISIIQKNVAMIHVNAVQRYISNLSCSEDEKKKIIDIIDRVIE